MMSGGTARAPLAACFAAWKATAGTAGATTGLGQDGLVFPYPSKYELGLQGSVVLAAACRAAEVF